MFLSFGENCDYEQLHYMCFDKKYFTVCLSTYGTTAASTIRGCFNKTASSSPGATCSNCKSQRWLFFGEDVNKSHELGLILRRKRKWKDIDHTAWLQWQDMRRICLNLRHGYKPESPAMSSSIHVWADGKNEVDKWVDVKWTTLEIFTKILAIYHLKTH